MDCLKEKPGQAGFMMIENQLTLSLTHATMLGQISRSFVMFPQLHSLSLQVQ